MKFYERSSVQQILRGLHFLFVVTICFNRLSAQNLVPNPGFEDYTVCPPWLNTGNPLECVPWVSVGGTADYFNSCGFPFVVDVPYNFQGFQYTHMGEGYTGMYFVSEGGGSHEFIQVPLISTLQQDSCYKVSMWMNLANEGCGTNHGQILLSDGPPAPLIGANPQVNWGGEYFSDTLEWVNIFSYILADGNENTITIGNFSTNINSPIDPACPYDFAYGYYYVDDVEVSKVPIENFFIDLVGPVTACGSYTIDPGNPEVDYMWSTGSHGSTLTVTTSGTYSVTGTFGCTMAEAEIEVTIIPTTPVEIGVEELTLCTGETYTISLDPDLGNYEWNDGSSDSEYTISEAGVYSVTLDDGCQESEDQVVVTVNLPPAAIDLGPDEILCPGEMLSYDFDPLQGDFFWNDGTMESMYVIDEEGTYSLTISNNCGEVTDEIEVTSLDIPNFSFNADEALLCNSELLEFEFDDALGSFLWQDGSTSNFYSISDPGLYSLTITNECGNATDDIQILASVSPVVMLDAEIIGCAGDVVLLDPGNNDGDLVWQDGSTNQTFTPTSSGTYAVTVTNDCGSDYGSTEVIFNVAPLPPDLGDDLILCPGEEVTIYSNSSNGDFLWNDLSTESSLVVNASGIYYVQVSNNCGSFSDTLEVFVENNPPDVSLPPDFLLCQGQSALLNPNIAGVNYSWSDGSILPQLQVTSPGAYAVTVSNACGSDIDTVVVADGGAAPMVSLGQDTSLCAGQSYTITPVFNAVTNWSWQDGSVADTLLVVLPGNYSIHAENLCGIADDTLFIAILPPVPLLSLGNDTVLCPGENVTLSISIPNVTIAWSDGSSNANLTVPGGGPVYASISNSCGTSSDTAVIGLLPAIPPLNLGSDQSICPGTEITLTPGIAGVTYLWQNGSIDTFYTTTNEGLITLTITNACGTATDSLEVFESTMGPDVNLGPDLQGCEGETITIPANISGVNYTWQDGSTENTFSAAVSGVYSLTVDNLCGSDIDSVLVDISGVEPSPFLGNDTLLCEGVTLLLTSNADPITTWTWQDGSISPTYLVSQAGNYILNEINRCGEASDTINISYSALPAPFDLGEDTTLCEGQQLTLLVPIGLNNFKWQDGTITPTYLVTQAGTYTLTETNLCGVADDNLIVTFISAPAAFDLGPDLLLCPDEVILLQAPVTSDQIEWEDGSEELIHAAGEEKIYSLRISNRCGVSTDSVELTYDTDIPLISLEPQLIWCEGEEFTLDATQTFNAIYLWSTGATASSIIVDTLGDYNVHVFANCADIEAGTEVVLDPACVPPPVIDFYLPNVFSPNGDQVNDVFVVSFSPDLDILSSEGFIYDRWGNMIFNSKEIPFAWDGNFSAKPMLPGVYVYVVDFSFSVNGQLFQHRLTGDVTLIR